MSANDLTEELTAVTMARADQGVCAGHNRCYAFLDPLEDVRETCTPKGRCKVGWIVRAGGRESWDVWVEVSTGLAKLIRRVNACPSARTRSWRLLLSPSRVRERGPTHGHGAPRGDATIAVPALSA